MTIKKGRIEDLLELGVKTEPPVMTGNVRFQDEILFASWKSTCESEAAAEWNVCGGEYFIQQ